MDGRFYLPRRRWCVLPSLLVVLSGCSHSDRSSLFAANRPDGGQTGYFLRGQGHNGDFTVDAPGVRHVVKVTDLPEPYATPSVENFPRIVRRPEGALPKAPQGFKVTEFAAELINPRYIAVAPNGDVFIAESEPGRIKVLRDSTASGKAETVSIFVSGLNKPFGIAFYPPGPNPRFIYIGNTDEVIRFTYRAGEVKATSPPEHVCDLPGGGRLAGGGHWTRTIAFSPDTKRMFVSVGSFTNVMERGPTVDENRADILEFTPDGKNQRIFASGIRNAVGLAIHPQTGELWASVNERDGLGDDLVPEYITHVKEGGFYGWPWYYLGPNQDPRHRGAHPELKNKVIVPDVLVQSHSASLEMCFYTANQFPAVYRGSAFAAQHGSWNRRVRTAYKVIRVLFNANKATGEYEDFLTGFVNSDGTVWGRPVGVAIAKDGALLVSDDGSGTVWRVAHSGRQ